MARHVLVTRPQPHADALVAALQDAGQRALSWPLFRFEAGADSDRLVAALSGLGRGDALVAISQPAVGWTAQYLAEAGLPWPSQPTLVAVGEATATQLRQCSGRKVLIPAQASNEGLLLLPCWAEPARAVLLKGQEGRTLLAEQLRQNHWQVDELESYRRVKLPPDPALVTSWQQQAVDTLLFTSIGAFTLFTEGLDAAQRRWVQQCDIVVASQRIASAVRAYGCARLTIAQGASNQQLLAAINHLTA